MPIVLDLIDDEISTAFDATPNRSYLLDKEGRVVYRDKVGKDLEPTLLAQAIRRHLRATGQLDNENSAEQVQEITFSEPIDGKAVAAHLEAIAHQFSASKFNFEANGETLSFDVAKTIEFELQADYNPDKKKYSVKLYMDWRHA